MSLTLLVVMVAVGISAIVVAVHWTGGTVVAVLETEEAARRRFADDFADISVDRVWLTASGNAAFLRLADGRTGIVSTLGSKFLTRIISRGDAAVRVTTEGAAVRLEIDDFTWRGGPFTFASEEDAQAVAGLLQADRQFAEGVDIHA